ncbi:hypothetical protein SESBI_21554 [Sesbania bispinosa]|nr:hypothetical protein SESBI_21554 [Sesbania bispinosa]
MSTSFFGINLHAPLKGINGNHLERRHSPKSKRYVVSAKHGTPVRQAFSFCGQNVNLLRRHLVSASGSRLKCTREPPFSLNVSFFKALWKEGLLLIRASVYTVVISGLCLLVWFGRNKAKSFVEANILPSVCSVISEYIQRDIQFGKVRRITPLSVTLESCSFGPHKEEFSCGEALTVKLRFHPLASLRRGMFVVDAILSHPNVLVVQKKDYSWLGIPSTEGGGIKRHLSSGEGIDHRTRTRRLAREEAAAQWTKERDDAAREAAEMGYFVSEQNCGPSQGDDLKEIASHSIGATNSSSFFCMNEGKHIHHCMDKGVDYDMKHADLEKSFGVKFPGSGLKFWSRVIKGHWKRKFRRKAKRSDICASGVAIKRRILERSALAAHTYFCDQSHGTQSTDLGIRSPSANENVNGRSDHLKFVSDQTQQPRESKHKSLQSNENAVENAHANSSKEKNEELGLHAAHSPIDDNVTGSQGGLVPEDLVSLKSRPWLATNSPVPLEPLIVKLSLASFFRNIEELISGFLSGFIQKLKSDMGLKIEDIVAEHVDGVNVDGQHSEGLTKILPVTLDSVHFRGATVMLLAYGDREVRCSLCLTFREMENVNGHVKFLNHYTRINVQLSGNCKTWRSGVSEDGGWLFADVFVNTIEKKWHANLKVDNLFVPFMSGLSSMQLFERILEIPITWSKGRASGEVLL